METPEREIISFIDLNIVALTDKEAKILEAYLDNNFTINALT